MLGPWEIAVLGVGAVAAVVLSWTIFKAAANREEIDEWAIRHGVTLTEASRPVVAGYLVRSRKYRLKGALIGLVVPLQLGVPGLEMALGYLTGALVAELTQKRPLADGARSASLSPRSISDYLPSYATALMRGVSAAGAVLLPVYLLGPPRTGNGTTFQVSAVIGGSAVILLPLLIEFMVRRMVARPQPAASPDLLAADDAIRASSIHAVAGAGTCAAMLLLGTFAWVTGVTSDLTVLRWALPALGTVSYLSGLAIWFKLGPTAAWKVRREFGAAGVEA